MMSDDVAGPPSAVLIVPRISAALDRNEPCLTLLDNVHSDVSETPSWIHTRVTSGQMREPLSTQTGQVFVARVSVSRAVIRDKSAAVPASSILSAMSCRAELSWRRSTLDGRSGQYDFDIVGHCARHDVFGLSVDTRLKTFETKVPHAVSGFPQSLLRHRSNNPANRWLS